MERRDSQASGPPPNLGRRMSTTSTIAQTRGLESVVAGKTKMAWNSKTPWFDEEFEVELNEGFIEVASKCSYLCVL